MARCPKCNTEEVDAMTPFTVYGCGSKDYDQRPGTFKQSDECLLRVKAIDRAMNTKRQGIWK